MLTILTTTDIKQKVQEVISSVDKLDELVSVSKGLDAVHDLKVLVVENDAIQISLDWYDLEPPYLFPSMPFSTENLLALIFYKLGNHQKAFEFVREADSLYEHLLIATHLQFGYGISEEMLAFTHETSLHNYAILHYYGVTENTIVYAKRQKFFVDALENAANEELQVFTAKHYVNLLLDEGELEAAKQLVENHWDIAISDEGKFAMNVLLAEVLTAGLQVPYDEQQLDKIQELQLKAIAHYESKGLNVQAGLKLIDAAEIANFQNDFIASKELINRAIQYFREEDIPEFLGEAGLKKAILLYTWSKNGNPQYYKAAINSFQDVLKVFKRDTHPQKFADVHHNLALIYSEIPVSPEEKPMWTAFSASSFKEVLSFYTKDKYPYEYAMASHNYATALMNFPPAKIHDNHKKANGLFKEALEIRTAKAYPFERALTLLNQLELEWLTHNKNGEEERKKYERMRSMAEEVILLVDDKALITQAEGHLNELEKIKSLI